ncbi:nucleolar protein 9-like [Watersipora subatra]|uniref:nucleolar protein 9-like n=1 Tax=Watersipora subatra TaxID=2589382 RepID=UPI00355C4A06
MDSEKSQSHRSQRKDIPSSDVFSYFHRISQELEAEFPDDEQKELFLNNIFDELETHFVAIVTHKRHSYTVQKLVNLLNSDQLERIFRRVLKDFEILAEDPAASHVLETVLFKATHFFDADNGDVIRKLVYLMGMKMVESPGIITSQTGSYTARALIAVVSGLSQPDEGAVSSTPANSRTGQRDVKCKDHEFYEEFAPLLRVFSNQLLPTSDATFGLIHDSATSALAQTLMAVVAKADQDEFRKMCSAIINNGLFDKMDADGLPAPMTSKSGSYYCSKLFQLFDSHSMGVFIEQVIVPHFDELLAHPIANHALKDVIGSVREYNQFKKVCELLKGKLLFAISQNRGGLVHSLASAAVGFPKREAKLLQSLNEELDNPEINLIFAIASGSPSALKTAEKAKALNRLPYWSSQLLQKMFNFKDTTQICASLSSIPADNVVTELACSKTGSYVLESVFTSTNVDQSFKLSFLRSLLNYLSIMITDKVGSRVFDSAWPVMTIPLKKEVMEALKNSVAAIMRSQTGKFVARNIMLQDYIHSRDTWNSWVIAENQKRSMKYGKNTKKISKDSRSENLKVVQKGLKFSSPKQKLVKDGGASKLPFSEIKKKKLASKTEDEPTEHKIKKKVVQATELKVKKKKSIDTAEVEPTEPKIKKKKSIDTTEVELTEPKIKKKKAINIAEVEPTEPKIKKKKVASKEKSMSVGIEKKKLGTQSPASKKKKKQRMVNDITNSSF